MNERALKHFYAEPIDSAWATRVTRDLVAALDTRKVERIKVECRKSICLVQVRGNGDAEPAQLKARRTGETMMRGVVHDLRKQGHPVSLNRSGVEQPDGGEHIVNYWLPFVR